jgi:hypothetical protein
MGKKVNGCKRHPLVDFRCLLTAVSIAENNRLGDSVTKILKVIFNSCREARGVLDA